MNCSAEVYILLEIDVIFKVFFNLNCYMPEIVCFQLNHQNIGFFKVHVCVHSSLRVNV